METNHQTEIFRAMAKAEFYPHEVSTVEQRETHISRVFLTGQYVYKIKKSISLGILQSDFARKKLFHIALDGTSNLLFEEGLYSKASAALIYGKILMLAQQEIKQGRSIILDADFSLRHHRYEALRLARDMDANIIFMECTASIETLKQRLSIRDASDKDSDLRQRQFKQLCAQFESLHELPDELHIRINTDLPPAESLRQTLAHDYALLSQQTAAAIKHWESG